MDTTEHEIDLFEFAELSQAANPSPAPETAPEQGVKFNRNTMEQSVLAFVLSRSRWGR